jgi:2-oxoglutarate dehydrogenase E2 component (dihydrolipoamide succinyltransferase)
MIAIKVPPLGESIVEATIARWLKNEGDAVAAGETLVELETDKITVEVPALKGGVLTKRMHNEGDVVKVDDVLGELDESASATGTGAGAAATGGAKTAAAEAESGGPAAATAVAAPPAESANEGATPAASGEVRASPGARRLAAEEKVDLRGVSGTGRGGVVSKSDVIEQGKPAAAAPSPARSSPAKPSTPAPATSAAASTAAPSGNGARETREKMSTRRRRIAEHLLESQHATAHLTTFNEIDMTAVMGLRERLKERVEKEHGVKLSYMPFFVKAACSALRAYPVINAQVDGDAIVYKHYVNMGIAVASEQGLVVPNVKDAERKSMLDVSRDITSLAKRARESTLTMDDLTGGTFTITNGGVFGSLVSTPIINYPQVAILGLHKIQDRPVAIDGKVEIRPMMYVALSYDHRIVDGQQAVLFLVRIKELMEEPASMLLD